MALTPLSAGGPPSAHATWGGLPAGGAAPIANTRPPTPAHPDGNPHRQQHTQSPTAHPIANKTPLTPSPGTHPVSLTYRDTAFRACERLRNSALSGEGTTAQLCCCCAPITPTRSPWLYYPDTQPANISSRCRDPPDLWGAREGKGTRDDSLRDRTGGVVPKHREPGV